MTRGNIVRFGFLLAGVLFLFSALKPTFVGGSMNATFLIIGAACVVLGVAIGRKSGGPHEADGRAMEAAPAAPHIMDSPAAYAWALACDTHLGTVYSPTRYETPHHRVRRYSIP